MGNINKLVFAALVGCWVLVGPGVAHPAILATYSFDCLTANGVGSPEIGEAQLFVDVTDDSMGVALASNQVNFHFRNIGPQASSITDVYFDDGTLLGIASVSGSSGVSFSQGATPGNLPSGNNADPDFEATAGFTADSDNPIMSNGVNPGEYLDIVFNLLPGKTRSDALAALDGGVDLRIGIHVQAFANGASEAFVNDPPEPPQPPEPGPSLPEPTSLAVWGIGLVVVAVSRRRRR